jgi:hypothetical protein
LARRSSCATVPGSGCARATAPIRTCSLRGFARLSPESRYRRFLTATPELTEEAVRYLTEIDHHDHEAIAALDEEIGEGIGIARYVRNPERPDDREPRAAVIGSRGTSPATKRLPRDHSSTSVPTPFACQSSISVTATSDTSCREHPRLTSATITSL